MESNCAKVTCRCGCSSRGLLCRICNIFARRVRIGGLLLLAQGNRGGLLLRYRYRKGPLDLTFTPQYPQHRQQQTQCNQSFGLNFQPSLPPVLRRGTFSIIVYNRITSRTKSVFLQKKQIWKLQWIGTNTSTHLTRRRYRC